MATSSDELLLRCTFPDPGTRLDCAYSGGPDSTALIWLAREAGCVAVAHHVDHGIRPESAAESERARAIAEGMGVEFVLHTVTVAPGPNLEARARAARRAALPVGTATGHTADDQAETFLLRLLRGSGTTGLAAMRAGPSHPILRLRRVDTVGLCSRLGIEPVDDPSNRSADHRRNRVRHELLPLADDIARRDVTMIIARAAELLADDDEFLEELAGAIDPADARAVATAPEVLARRALRRWLMVDGFPPDRAAIDRALAVARGEAIACELPGGRRLARRGQRFHIVAEGE
ncbi:MAG: tRNA lysidine(34) synthetase TilS [Ilumatobacteraceae bacterium]